MDKNIKSRQQKLALVLIGEKTPIKIDVPTKVTTEPPPCKGVKFHKKRTPRYGGPPRNNTKYK